MSPKSPEIFKRALSEFQTEGLPAVGTDAHGEAVLQRVMLDYASRGFTAAVSVDGDWVRGVAVPQSGIEPKEYMMGLLREGFLEDALPSLEILSEIVSDADVEYNLGLCLSELGRVAESVPPLRQCLKLDPDYHHAKTALGVSLSKLGEIDEAVQVLRDAASGQPEDLHANRNLGALLARTGRADEALPLLQKAHKLAPEDVGATLGLAECLLELGPDYFSEAETLFRSIINKHPNHPVSEQAKAGLTRLAHLNLRNQVPGGVRMDAVMYMANALRRFSEMDVPKIGQITMEIARKGETGLKINEPNFRYQLESLDGDFSGLELLCMMHVGLQKLQPGADSGSGLEKEYEAAVDMFGETL